MVSNLYVSFLDSNHSEMIHYGMELVTAKRTLMDLANRLYVAVTFHELYRLAAENGLISVKEQPMVADTTLVQSITTRAVEGEEKAGWEFLTA